MSNFGHVLRSLASPRSTTIVPPTEAAEEHHHPETDEYATLKYAKPKAKPKAHGAGGGIAPLAAPGLTISPAFKLVVLLIFALIILTGAALIFLGLQSTQAYPKLESVSNLIGAAFTGSVGAFLGLIGGKAI
jgi:hypothetical protein